MADFRSGAEKIQSESRDHPTVPSSKSGGGVSEATRVSLKVIFTFHFHALEKEMAAHSSVLAWRIPGTGELGGLPSVGSHRVRHD